MPDPIPDAALRALDARLEVGAVVDVGGHGIDLKQLGRDFLALREAARRVSGWGQTAGPHVCKCGYHMAFEDGPKAMAAAWTEHAKTCAIEALRALLPEPPRG